jgi:hypothetical protein
LSLSRASLSFFSSSCKCGMREMAGEANM